MISVENPLLVDGAVVFRDSDDASLFWVLPSTPQLAATPTGGSSFELLEYRKADGTGGAFAQLEVELATATVASLVAQSGRADARLAPMMFRGGDVSLITIQGSGDSLVQSVQGSTVAPLVTPYHAVFALDLSEAGAALLAQAATLPTAPVGVIYELQFLALTPALHAHVTMDYSRVYDHFSVALGFTYYVSVRLDAEFSWLVEHGFVTVEITEFTDQADQQSQEQAVLDLVKARIEADFFSSSLPQDPADTGLPGPLGQLLSNQLGSKVSSTSALFTLKARVDIESELKQFTFDYNGKTAVVLTHVVSGFLGPMVPGATSAPVIRQITATDSFYDTLDLTASLAVDYSQVPDLVEAIVTITYGTTPARSFVATPDTPGPFRFTCPMQPGTPDYLTHVEFHFDPTSTAGPATMAAPDSTRDDRAFVTSTADAFQVLRVQVTAIAPASALVPQLQVNLSAEPAAGGAAIAQTTLVLDATHPQLDWYDRVPVADGVLALTARTDWVDADGTVHTGDVEPVVALNYVARGPIKEQMSIEVQPTVDWQTVTQVVVEIRHDVLGSVEDQTFTFTASDGTAPQLATISLSDPTQRSYQWRATISKADGTSAAGDWATTDVGILTVNDQTPPQTGVRVVWVGDQGSALAMRVDFWQTPPGGSEQQVASALLEPGQTDTSVTLPGDTGAPLSYRFAVTRIDATGDTVVESGQDTTRLIIVRTTGSGSGS